MIYRMKQYRPVTEPDYQISVVIEKNTGAFSQVHATEAYAFRADVECVGDSNDFIVHSSDVGDDYYKFDEQSGKWLLE